MRYRDPNLSEQLAAEYVLGTLGGRARKRFEHLLRQYPHLQQKVEEWELSLNKLSGRITPVEPPPQIWQNLQHSLFQQPAALRWYERISLWRGLTMVSSALAVVLAVMLFVTPPTTQTHYVLLLNNSAQQTGWSMSTSTDMEQFYVNNLKPMKMPENQGCLLWVQPADSGTIYLLGRLPDDGSQVVLPINKQLRALLLDSRFIVTIEDMQKPMPDVPTHPSEFSGQLIPMTSI
jgi:anti-sigma-K factor RskA